MIKNYVIHFSLIYIYIYIYLYVKDIQINRYIDIDR